MINLGRVVEVISVTLAKKKQDDSRLFAIDAARIAMDRHCTNVAVLDLRGLSPAADYFVIATGTSDRQRRNVIDEVCQRAKELGLQRFGQAGYEQGRWILVDFVDVVVHVFDEEYRSYYDLEMLWGDAKRLRVKQQQEQG